MQVVARLMNRALIRKGAHATVIGATSGDTGAAAIEAFRGLEAIDVLILHPKGRASDVQRRQMTTATERNVHNIALEGTFDDCQGIVKSLFGDGALRDRLGLTGINSINFARILAQVPYYFTAGVSLGAPHHAIAFTVPTGNFGDIFAGYAARAMGLPVARLVIATNLNDSLPRALALGQYEPKGVIATSSPSMDIQLASNFERLLFELSGRSAQRVRALMDELRTTKAFRLTETELAELRSLFTAHSVGEHDTEMTIRGLFEETGVLADPLTAGVIGPAMLATTAIAADGVDQRFGMRLVPGAGSKQGWGGCLSGFAGIHSMGFTADRIVVVLSGSAPDDDGLGEQDGAALQADPGGRAGRAAVDDVVRAALGGPAG